jgi:serine/threonine-protein kinase
MTARVCPECSLRSESATCPRCGSRTLQERRAGTAPDPFVGKVFEGRYRIDVLIGRGGMGAVYRALQVSMDKVVAVKVIRADFAGDLEVARRFHREAKAASLLSHPHTIRVFEFGQTEEGDLYLVMELLSGRSLARVMREDGPLPVDRGLKIVAQVAQSLAEAHAAGLVHRDLKPDNIVLEDVFGDRDFVKVLDFGIAKFLAAAAAESDATQEGCAVGTPQYMAPEQAQGGSALTPAIDVYSLGVLFHQMLTGTRPFHGPSPIEVMMAHVNRPVPELPPGHPASHEVRTLLRRMLAKDPRERPTAPELIDTITALRAAGTPVTTDTHWPPVGPDAARIEASGAESHEAPTQSVDMKKVIGAGPPASGHQGGRRVAVLWAGLAFGLAGLIGTGIVLGLQAGKPDSPIQTEATASVAPPAPVPEAAPDPVPATPKPAFQNVRFESNVAGARVFEDGKELGRTPLERPYPAGAGTRTWVFRLEGFRDASVTGPIEAGRISAILVREDSRPPVAPKPKKARRNDYERLDL